METDSEIDGELCAQMARGDSAALGRLYDRHAPVLLGVARRILGTPRDAEDLVHDVFLEAWKRAGSYDAARGSVRTWLLMRLRSRAIDRARSLAVAREHALARPAGDPEPPPADPGRAVDHARACHALAALAPAQREVLELAYFEGLSCSEIAARRGIPLGTVKSRLGAGVAQLRRELTAAGTGT